MTDIYKKHSYGERHEFVTKLPLIMVEAGRLGLFQTMHCLHEAVQKSGYELAELHFDKSGTHSKYGKR